MKKSWCKCKICFKSYPKAAFEYVKDELCSDYCKRQYIAIKEKVPVFKK